jgi:hypothetical protein
LAREHGNDAAGAAMEAGTLEPPGAAAALAAVARTPGVWRGGTDRICGGDHAAAALSSDDCRPVGDGGGEQTSASARPLPCIEAAGKGWPTPSPPPARPSGGGSGSEPAKCTAGNGDALAAAAAAAAAAAGRDALAAE